MGWREAGAAARDGGNGPVGDGDVVSHLAAPSSYSGYSDPFFQNVSQMCLPCSVPFTGFILTQNMSQRSF